MTDKAQREKEILNQALEIPSVEARHDFVRVACQGDAALRESVDSLLAAYTEASGFIPTRLGDGTTLAVGVCEEVGAVIDRYKLLQKLGEGGCGTVYMAEQEEPVRRMVALKVIKLGMDTKAVIARFAAERQALAMMDHPNIAKVLDAGATASGRPYFVMELVRGIRITDYCNQNQLATRDRIELFLKVCRAIAHAHQKGIIHRDIKPSNILVTMHDGVPVPKVIDFGIAKATAGRLVDQTLFTAFEQFLGTPAYMSPEQAEMSGLSIDTRTDVYSLGVLLYELLTGRTPFDVHELLSQGIDAMRQAIREKEPLRPSTRLNQIQASQLADGGPRCQIQNPKSKIDWDLDWVVMRCLEKDRARRYASVNGLLLDMQHHLEHRPVSARPPSMVYRVQKLVRRRRAELLTGGVIAGVALLALAWNTRQAVRARRMERLAEEQAEIARTAQTFIKEQLPHLYRMRLGEPSTAEPTPGRTAPTRSIYQRILSNDETVQDVPEQVKQAYLALNHTNAESRLATYGEGEQGRTQLRQAATTFPDNPAVLFMALTLGALPDEDRRAWLERFKAVAPDNGLPFYLSARAYLKAGDTENALNELQAGTQVSNVNDYGPERMQAHEELYLQEGRSAAEAKTVAGCGLLLPHLKALRELSDDLVVLQQQYAAAGQATEAEAAARYGVLMSRQLSNGTGGDCLICQKVGLEIEQKVLMNLPSDSTYDWLGGTPAQRSSELDQQLASLDEARTRSDRLLAQASDAELVAYFDRFKLYGEAAALRWLEQRTAQGSTGP
jgi:hypothetical protein